MKIGVVFPQTEIGSDPVVLRDYAQAVEGLGYDHLLAYDHVLGADPDRPGGWNRPYDVNTEFHEPFVLFGYLAAVTSTLELVTNIIILPQRQTALVAKQAAEVDVLSGGRLRLGVGTGWNWVEYQALNENFRNRGARSEEQIGVLRALWAEPVITYRGRWHQIDAAGINPRPPRGWIPIWIGGHAEPVLRRIARLGDGWFPLRPPNDQTRAEIERLRAYTREAGRPPEAVGIEPQLGLGSVPETWWTAYADAWRALGATHLGINTMGAGLASPQAHIDALRRVKEALRVGQN